MRYIKYLSRAKKQKVAICEVCRQSFFPYLFYSFTEQYHVVFTKMCSECLFKAQAETEKERIAVIIRHD